MSIESNYNLTAIIKRLTAVGGGSNRTAWESVATDVLCAIHPSSGEHQQLATGAFYTTHKMYCPSDADVRDGDRVVVDTDTYTVRGVDNYNFGRTGSNSHLRVMLVKGV